jgi:hypothetical protein
VVSVNVNHEEYVLRELAAAGASSSIFLEAYTSKDLIKKDGKIKPLGVQWVVSLQLKRAG